MPGNLPYDRPQRWDNPQACELSRGKEPHAIIGRACQRHIAREVAEFIHRLLELLVRFGGWVGQAKWGLPKAVNAVGNGDFTGERLQGRKALVGIFHLGLQLDELMFQIILIAAKGVVIRCLPQHARIRTHSGNGGDPTHNRKHRKAMKDVKRDAHSAHAAGSA